MAVPKKKVSKTVKAKRRHNWFLVAQKKSEKSISMFYRKQNKNPY